MWMTECMRKGVLGRGQKRCLRQDVGAERLATAAAEVVGPVCCMEKIVGGDGQQWREGTNGTIDGLRAVSVVGVDDVVVVGCGGGMEMEAAGSVEVEVNRRRCRWWSYERPLL